MKTVEILLTIFGAIATAGFFLWKMFAGWLIVNLSVSIDLYRQHKDDENDYLSIKLILEKGTIDTLWLEDVSIRIKDQITGERRLDFPELVKLPVKGGKIKWIDQNPNLTTTGSEEKISLSPSETLHFGRWEVVPSGVPVLVEAAVFGTRTFWKKGFQWRASCSSLPIPAEENRKPT